MALSNTTVQEEVKVGVAPATPAPAGVPAVQGTTGATSTDDVAKLQADLKAKDAELARLTKKFEDDLNKMRSSEQKDKSTAVSALSERIAQAEAERDEAAMRGMDATQRAAYERDRAVERADAAEARAQEAEAARQEQQEFQDTVNFMLQDGVPATALDTKNGMQGLAASGWAYWKKQAAGVATPAPVAPANSAVPAPDVLVTGQGTPATKKTMEDLIKEYATPGEHPDGTRTRIYEMIANGDLPASILPV